MNQMSAAQALGSAPRGARGSGAGALVATAKQEKLDAALRAALASDGPSLVDIVPQPLQEAHAPVSEWIA